MLLYGNSEAVKISFSGSGIIYNFTSFLEGFERINIVPPNYLGRYNDRDFDIVYMKYIMENDYIFTEFFKIIYNLYIGNDVFLIVSDDDWSENLIESLLKLIQQRYGYNAVYIRCEEDYLYAKNNVISNFDPDYGLLNLDNDKQRYSALYEYSVNNGIKMTNLEGLCTHE